jgi:hypothetical protein
MAELSPEVAVLVQNLLDYGWVHSGKVIYRERGGMVTHRILVEQLPHFVTRHGRGWLAVLEQTELTHRLSVHDVEAGLA